MAYNMPKGLKLCGTCGYWVGPREPDYYAYCAVLPEQSTKGKCYCRSCPFTRGERLSNSSACLAYKRWVVLD